MKLSESEWSVLEILWSGTGFSLKEITSALQPINKWNKNTVYTYLTRMESKGLVAIDRTQSKPYSASISREECERNERNELLNKVYGGVTSHLIAAFLKESKISKQECERLKQMLDNMEV